MGNQCSALIDQVKGEKAEPEAEHGFWEDIEAFATAQGESENKPDKAQLDAFKAQWEFQNDVPAGTTFGVQGEPVDYLYMVPPSHAAKKAIERTWNEPEKMWLLRDPATGKTLMKGFGLTWDDAPLKASYSNPASRTPVPTTDLNQANPVYTTTTFMTGNPGPKSILKWNYKAHWASAPESIKHGINKVMASLRNDWQEISNEREYQRVHQDMDGITVRRDHIKEMRVLEAQFKANQAAWGYSHWGPVQAVWTDESAYERENEATKLKEYKEGSCWILCQAPQSPFNGLALAAPFRWTAPWDEANDKWGQPQLLNEPAINFHDRSLNPNVLKLKAKLVKEVQAAIKEEEGEGEADE